MKLKFTVYLQILAAVIAAETLPLEVALAQDEVENPPTLKLDRIMSSPAFAGQTRAPAAQASEYEVETLVGGLSLPWALAFLPDEEILISEYATGNMLVLDDSGQHVSAQTLDHRLWNRGQNPHIKAQPRHRTRCTFY